ncbi:hypothetical protein Ahy_A01g002920 isoform E [Arachis hypogaea]|uniref:PITH domain-containing protein n=1 Tax=Arachis hypogaea TaxID=3818 RepID=A0A445ERU8_ARAHY|nr:hypothetical protein Ahy_A01g002920 isoform E [Arachis hypogaea]
MVSVLVLKVTLFKNPVADLSLFQLKMGICNQDAIKQLQSMMENVNEQQKITFQDAWQCDICGSKSERGFDVKIKSISIVGGADGTSPAKMRAFINRDGIDFSDAQSMQAIQLGVLKKAGSPIQHVIQVVRKNDPLGRDVELFRRHYYAPGQVGPASKDILLLTDRK